MDKINNKNAREKALLEEAYGNVYKEGQFWGRDDLVKKGKEEDIARGAVKLVGKTKGGNYTSAILPKGDPKIEELEAQGYKREPIEDEQNPDADTWGGGMKGPFEAEDRGPGPEEEEDITTKFQPGQFVDVLGDDGEFSHQEVVLKVTGDVVNTIRVVGEGKPYGDTAKGYYDINLISPQDLESGKYSADFKPADGREW